MEENVQATAPVSTRSVGMKWGLYSALAGIVFFIIPIILGQNPFGGGWNWAGTVLTIVFMFLAHKNFKESGDGYMSYGQGIGIGFWFVLISMIVGFGFSFLYVTFIDTGVMDTFFDQQRAGMEEAGQSDEAIEMALSWTKKLFWPMGLLFGFIGGMVIALILTIFTQKKAPDHSF